MGEHMRFIVDPGTLTINQPIGYHTTVELDPYDAVLIINHPKTFHGVITNENLGPPAGIPEGTTIDLVGLAKHAASWSFNNDLLAIFNAHGRVIDTVRTTGGYQVQEVATAGGNLYATNGIANLNNMTRTLLPVHT